MKRNPYLRIKTAEFPVFLDESNKFTSITQKLKSMSAFQYFFLRYDQYLSGFNSHRKHMSIALEDDSVVTTDFIMVEKEITSRHVS